MCVSLQNETQNHLTSCHRKVINENDKIYNALRYGSVMWNLCRRTGY